MNEIVSDIINQMLTVCDGAHSVDGQGFNKYDAQFFRNDTYEESEAIERLMKYKNQIQNMGFDYDALKSLQPKIIKEKSRKNDEVKIEVVNDELHITTPYNVDFVSSIKKLRNRKWNGKCWVVKITVDQKDAKTAIETVNYHYHTNFQIELPEISLGTIEINNNIVVFKTGYDESFVIDIKNCGGKWNGKNWKVEIDDSIITKIEKIIEKYNLKGDIDKLYKTVKKIKKEKEEMKKLSQSTQSISINKDSKLYSFQEVGVKWLEKTNGKALIADEMGCISGDALISINRCGRSYKIKLKDLYERFNNLNKNNRYIWNTSNTYARSLISNNTFRLNKILKVIDKGIKEVIEIKTNNNKRLKLTPDHEVLTENGWIRCDQLKIGDIIFTNGQLVCKNCGSSENIITYKYAKFYGYCKVCMYRQLRNNHCEYKERLRKGSVYISGNLKYHPNNTTGGIAKHRLIIEANMNGLSLNEWLLKIKTNNLNGYKFLPNNLHVHHINKNPIDNRIENLELVTVGKHHKIHERYININTIFIPKKEKITKIKYVGNDHVYDIVMDDLGRNFIANGIVVHNCGKTIQTLAYLKKHQEIRPVIIICPSSVKLNWEKEIKKWCNTDKIEIIKNRKGKISSGQEFYVINYDIISSRLDELKKLKSKCIVIDESHKIKNYKAKRTQAVVDLTKNIKHVICLTGTPVVNRPSELWTTLQILQPKDCDLQNFWEYMKKYTGAIQTRFGWDFSGADNLVELQDRLRSTIMIRRLKKDVLNDLPEKQKSYIDFKINNRKEYKFALNNFRLWYEENEDKILEEQGQLLVQMEKLKQVAVNGKTDEMIKFIKDIIENGEKVVVFAHHINVQNQITKEINALKITGGMSSDEKQKIIDEFNNGDKSIVVSLKAGAEGINLQSSSTVIFTELGWTPAEMIQAEDRVHRIGQKNAVNIYYLIAKETIEEDIIDMLNKKEKIVNEMLNNGEITEINSSIIDVAKLVIDNKYKN